MIKFVASSYKVMRKKAIFFFVLGFTLHLSSTLVHAEIPQDAQSTPHSYSNQPQYKKNIVLFRPPVSPKLKQLFNQWLSFAVYMPAYLPLSPEAHSDCMKNIIFPVVRDCCVLVKHKQFHHAVTQLEKAMFRLQEVYPPKHGASIPFQFAGIPLLWSNLVWRTSSPDMMTTRMQQWMQIWPAELWLEHAPDVLIQTLANQFPSDTIFEPAPCLDGYTAEQSQAYKTLQLLLGDNLPADIHSALMHMVIAKKSNIWMQEYHLKQAILSGYCHPLPYMELLNLLLKQNRLTDAYNLYALYYIYVVCEANESQSIQKPLGQPWQLKRFENNESTSKLSQQGYDLHFTGMYIHQIVACSYQVWNDAHSQKCIEMMLSSRLPDAKHSLATDGQYSETPAKAVSKKKKRGVFTRWKPKKTNLSLMSRLKGRKYQIRLNQGRHKKHPCLI